MWKGKQCMAGAACVRENDTEKGACWEWGEPAWKAYEIHLLIFKKEGMRKKKKVGLAL